jgi:hypothetical protein
MMSAGAQSGSAPERPRVFLNTDYTPPTGRTIAVVASGDFQDALNQAQPGDVITLEAGATFTGNFTLPNKSGQSGWIVIRSSAADSNLPPPGTRISPTYSNVLPKIVSPNSEPAIRAASGAHHFRFIGLEIGHKAGSMIYAIVDFDGGQTSLSEVPHDLIVDRCYIHGNPSDTSRRGVALNSASTAVIDSYISECHESGADSQAIAGWNGPGPFKIVNNYLEGAGENFILGGADPRIQGLIPSDIEFRHNHVAKPVKWKMDHTSYAGIRWSVKNLFELKNAQRVLIESNVFEYNWAESQTGFAILFTPRNQSGQSPWSVVQDVTFSNNVLRHSGSGLNIAGPDNEAGVSQPSRRILIRNNLIEDINSVAWGGDGRLFQIISGAEYVTIDHNTGFATGNILSTDSTQGLNVGLVFTNNIVAHNAYGVIGTGTGIGLATLTRWWTSFVFEKNVIVGGQASNYPLGNYFINSFSDVGFVDMAKGDYRLSSSSQYRNAGTDGRDIGYRPDSSSDPNPPNPPAPPDPPSSDPPPSSGPTPSGAQPVAWTQLVQAAANGAILTKIAGCAGCEATAVSQQSVAGDGYFQFTAAESNKERWVGLMRSGKPVSVRNIDFAFLLGGVGIASIRENGVYRAETTYKVGDVFRVAVEQGVVKYYKNNFPIYQSSVAATYPLAAAASILDLAGTVSNGAVWPATP